MPARKQALNSKRAAVAKRQPRDTGPAVGIRALVAARAHGACELCRTQLWTPHHGWSAAHSVHHRRPRGMGGTSRTDTNSPANLLLVCGTGTTGCHGWIESHRDESFRFGYLLRQYEDPAQVVVELHHGRVHLEHDGTYRKAAA